MSGPASKCSGAYSEAEKVRCSGPPAYIWTGAHGGEYLLCVLHCAEWRQQVRGIPVLKPVRIGEYQHGEESP